MADIQFSHNMGAYGREPEAEQGVEASENAFATMTNLAGAVVSLALIAGIGVWGYKLMVRDVSGIPVVRAAEGAMRVRPEEPGGQLALHQGLAVNDVAAEGTASGPVDQVTLAPRNGGLIEEDQPVALSVEAPKPLAPAAQAFEPSFQPAVVIQDEEAPVDLDTDAAINQLVAEVTADLSQDEVMVQTPAVEPTAIVAPGPRLSKRPRMRPENAQALIQNASYSPAPTASEIDAAEIPTGTRLAQLGAFDSAGDARGEWQRLSGRFGEYLAGKSRVIQEAQSGGRTFYRLRAMGFKDLSDSRRFCAAFKAEGVDCIPVASK